MTRSTAGVRLVRAALVVAVAAAGAAVLAVPTAHAMTPPTPTITRYAGGGLGPNENPVDGPATATTLNVPLGIALDRAGDLYDGDCGQTLSKITPAGQLTVVAGSGGDGPSTPGPALLSDLSCVSGVAVDTAGDVFFSDRNNHQIDKLSAGVLSVVAGTGAAGIPTPGPALLSALGKPDGLTFDHAGNLYVGDQSGHGLIYKITPAGQLVIVAGDGTYGPPVPGPALDSPLGAVDAYNNPLNPADVAVDAAGDLYLADEGNNIVEKVTPTGTLSVIAGRGADHPGPPTPGPASASALDDPLGVDVDTAGNVYITDSGNNSLEKVTPAGVLSVIAGVGAEGNPGYGYSAASSALDGPSDTAISPAGVIYLSDSFNFTVDRISAAAPAAPDEVTTAPGDRSASLSFRLEDAGSSAVTGYQVSLDRAHTWAALPTAAGPAGTRTAHLTGLTDSRTYPVQVRAVNAAGPGAPSPPITVTPQAGITAPGAPTAATATAGVHALTVTWQAPTDPGHPALTGYRVTVRDTTTRTTRIIRVRRVLTATVPAAPGHRYLVTVAAVSPDRTSPATPAPAVVAPYPIPRPSITAPRTTVLTPAHPSPAVTCQVSTGQLRACTVTLTARVRGHLVVLGRGRRTVDVATRTATVAVTLTSAGRVLADRVGGITATAAAAITTRGPAAVLTADGGVRLQAGSVLAGRVSFAPGRATLTRADTRVLTVLRHHLSGVRVVVCAGYTDTLGDNPYNARLGLARATATCAYLIHGTHLRAVAVSFGETHPAATNHTAAGRAANRRALVALDY